MIRSLPRDPDAHVGRHRPSTLVPWARRLLAEGTAVPGALREIYGVDLPDELWALHRAIAHGLDLPFDPSVHPWALLSLGGPVMPIGADVQWAYRQEERAFTHRPSFLVLGEILGEGAWTRVVIGYDLDELARGRTTVLGHAGELPDGAFALETVGPSLLLVLHRWQTEELAQVEAQLASPSNRGFGSIGPPEVEEVADRVRVIEALLLDTGPR